VNCNTTHYRANSSSVPGDPTDRVLARFKRGERLRTGQKRLRRGQEIPVAVLVDSVRLRKRFDLESAVRRKLPRLAQAIQKELRK